MDVVQPGEAANSMYAQHAMDINLLSSVEAPKTIQECLGASNVTKCILEPTVLLREFWSQEHDEEHS